MTLTWTGSAFGYIATTQGSTTATLVSEAGPVTPSGIGVPVFSDGMPFRPPGDFAPLGVNTLAALYPPPDVAVWPPVGWSLAGAVPVYFYTAPSVPALQLSAALSTSGPITSLPIDELGGYDVVRAWQTLTVNIPAAGPLANQNFIVTEDVGSYATSLPIVSTTPVFAFPANTPLTPTVNYYTISGNTLTTACAAVNTFDSAWAVAMIWNDV
jgi:hypothetical protein